MILHSRLGLLRAEFYFDEEPAPVKADIIQCYQSPVRRPGFRCIPFHTRIIDLRRPVDDIVREMKPKARREARRAEQRDGLSYCCCSSGDPCVLREMVELQDEFAAQKNLPPIDRPLMAAMAKAGILDISFVRDASGKPFAWGSDYRGPRRLRMLHGGSLFRALASSAERQLCGRANRMLSYKTILRARDLGICEFDLGGWYAGSQDQEKLAINRFKEEFGGVVVEEFHCFRGVTLKGKLALTLARYKNSFVERRRVRFVQRVRTTGRTSCGRTLGNGFQGGILT